MCPHWWVQVQVERGGKQLQVRHCTRCDRWDEQEGGAWRVMS